MTTKTLFYYRRKVSDTGLSQKKRKRNRDMTIAGVISENTIKIGIATCSRKDIFTKVQGRNIAEGRAKSKLLNYNEIPVKEGKALNSFLSYVKNEFGQ